MTRTTRFLLAIALTFSLVGADHATASESPAADLAAAAHRQPTARAGDARVLARSPWTLLDPLGDVMAPSGNLQRVVVENGRQQARFTFDLVGAPRWDNVATDRETGMVFEIDWRNTTLPPNRILVVTKVDNVWQAAILNGSGGVVCTAGGGVVTGLPNFAFRIAAPVQQCLGGAKVLRVGGGFVEDQDDGSASDAIIDFFPNGRTYGPFIALPSRARSGGGGEATTVNGWTVH